MMGYYGLIKFSGLYEYIGQHSVHPAPRPNIALTINL